LAEGKMNADRFEQKHLRRPHHGVESQQATRHDGMTCSIMSLFEMQRVS
jgi:hypothetical protein